MPSVQHLLHENGLPDSEADKIPASGPQGRLLKGDVLAYLGSIQSSYPSDLSGRISKLSHLDLTNIKVAPAKAKAKAKEADRATPAAPIPTEEPDSEIAVSISFDSALKVQKRIQDSLGIHLPLATFIARATELANDDLPRSKHSPTSDELFNQVLGLNKISRSPRGNFIPQLVALPKATIGSRAIPKIDIIDILARKSPTRRNTTSSPRGGIVDETVPATNVFTVTVPKGEEIRGRVFLERVKTVIEVEPGRLII
ncbi:MAG: pyridoxine biosynthesis protein [Vezdaea acicularis]|nr:MAG: pyridoxine biosynthesis protein [Vezdaea acicularis]